MTPRAARVTASQVIRVLENLGFRLSRQSGSHKMFKNAAGRPQQRAQRRRDPTPQWLKRFAVRGHLSYVRLGMEILRSPGLTHLVRRAVRWLGIHLWPWRPAWRPRQVRYRLRHW